MIRKAEGENGMKHKADRSDKAEKAPLRRWIAMFAITLSPIILTLIIALVIDLTDSIRTYRDIGVMPGSIVEGLEIKGDVPSWFTEEDKKSAADELAEYINSCKFTVLDVEYDIGSQDYIEAEYPGYPDNCRMVLGFTEYNYGCEGANIGIHCREYVRAVVVRDSESSPWTVIEHGYL